MIIVSAWLRTHNLRVWEMEKSTFFWPKDDYLLRRHGPKHMEKSVAVGMTIFYGSLFLLGVPGNFLTCLIIFMNSYMRAAPNYYLFNLAVADILTLSIGKLYSILSLFIFWFWARQSNPKNCFLSAVFVWWCKTSLDMFESYFFMLSFWVNSCHFVSSNVILHLTHICLDMMLYVGIHVCK